MESRRLTHACLTLIFLSPGCVNEIGDPHGEELEDLGLGGGLVPSRPATLTVSPDPHRSWGGIYAVNGRGFRPWEEVVLLVQQTTVLLAPIPLVTLGDGSFIYVG